MDALDALAPFLTAAAFVFCNEMGDKSQLLAAALAARLRWWKVLAGVALAVLAGNGLAVAAGALLAHVPGIGEWVRLVSSLLFLVFGLWSLADVPVEKRGQDTSGTAGVRGVAGVAATFFFAEMGDKTQLAAMTLAARFPHAPLWVLAGTAAGMLAADALAVAAGALMRRRLPATRLRGTAAVLFILFGLAGVWEWLTGTLLFPRTGALAAVALLGGIVFLLGRGIRTRARHTVDRYT